MEDYYRVRFRQILGARRPLGEGALPAPESAPEPRALRIVHGASGALAAIGWVAVVMLGRRSSLGEFAFILVPALLLPAYVALWLGFSEQQAWTRPLMVLLVSIPAGIALVPRAWLLGAIMLLPAVVAAGYLYGGSGARAYYDFLREAFIVRVSTSDLRSTIFLPLYSSGAGILLGAYLGYALTVRHLGEENRFGANDVTSMVCVAILFAGVLGAIGRWVGEGIALRFERAA